MSQNTPNGPDFSAPQAQPRHAYPGHPYPAPPTPPKKGGKLRAIAFGSLGVVVAIFIAGGLAANHEDTRTKGFDAPVAASPTPAEKPVAKPAPKVEETEEAEAPEPEPSGTYLTYEQIKPIIVDAYPTILSENENTCLSGADFTNGLNTVGVAVINDGCAGEEDEKLADIRDALEDSRYTYYVQGDNWMLTFETKAEAKMFVSGLDNDAIKAKKI